MLHLIIQFLLNYLSTGRLRQVISKRKFQILALKWSRLLTRGGCLQEVSNIMIGLGNFGILENWSLRRGYRLREAVAMKKKTELKNTTRKFLSGVCHKFNL